MSTPCRHVIVDLETTGLSPRQGHRVNFLRHEYARLRYPRGDLDGYPPFIWK